MARVVVARAVVAVAGEARVGAVGWCRAGRVVAVIAFAGAVVQRVRAYLFDVLCADAAGFLAVAVFYYATPPARAKVRRTFVPVAVVLVWRVVARAKVFLRPVAGVRVLPFAVPLALVFVRVGFAVAKSPFVS